MAKHQEASAQELTPWKANSMEEQASDPGGIIYLQFEDRKQLLPVKKGLVTFLNEAP